MRILSKRWLVALTASALALGCLVIAAELVARRAETRAEKILGCRMKAAGAVGVDVTAFDAARAVVTGHPPAAVLHLPWQFIADRAEALVGSRDPEGGSAMPVEADEDGLIVTRDTRFGSVTAKLDVDVAGSTLNFGIDSVELGGQQLSGSILEGMVDRQSLPTADLSDWLPEGVRIDGGTTDEDGLELDITMNRDALRKLEKENACRPQTS